jgi:phosphoribosylglycinamide formyltransferase-1
MTRIAIFASGSGTNAENLIKYFNDSNIARVTLVLSNNRNAKVLKRAKKLKVNALFFTKEELYDSSIILEILKENADFIVLAGFLWRIPKSLIDAFPNQIVNIHPALLPKYGGKGMYGMRVHETVKENKEKESGITIHYVNERYDEGNTIFQKKIPVALSDSADDIASKIHQLEYKYFPKVIEDLLSVDN